jgi:multidrug resistance efflux pump
MIAPPTSVPTVAPASAMCTNAVLHAYAVQGEQIVAHLRGTERAAIEAQLDAVSARVDGCVRAALTRLGSSLDETDSTLAFDAIERRMRMRVLRARAALAFGDRERARIELRDLAYDIGNMSDYTREHESSAFAHRRAIYDGFVRDLRDLDRRLHRASRR